ncbi:MAG: PilZ domain-containing protein [Pyrinomonadaceae bacterium]
MQTNRRMGQRFEISLPVRLEWNDEEKGTHIFEEGRTENVSENGTLVHLPRQLPRVGSTVKIVIFEAKGAEVVKLAARVLRIERNPAHPLAALMIDSTEVWRKNVWQNQSLIESFTDSVEEYED